MGRQEDSYVLLLMVFIGNVNTDELSVYIICIYCLKLFCQRGGNLPDLSSLQFVRSVHCVTWFDYRSSPNCTLSMEEILYISEGMWLWLFILIKKLIFTLLSKVNMNQVKHFLVWLDVNQQQLEIEVIFSYLHVSLRKLPLICVSFWGLREQHYSKLYDFVLLMHVTVSAWCRCPLLFENIWIMNRGRTSKAY